ncbi:zinc-binding dehydrogenase [Streptomyces reniochalinae]|uniref:Zinc-binding alcohol dehydrogenase family protein n=1 Tax=Streptomyces reniochalinae TaxID=2250578 RepID=A0A367E9M8_9ACTN|nr:zinc-binding dehydrogenase [Streptomyces reniochalinae]RCG14067.1 hypothetical protein DQ392_29635 [Streptomyces reniochalinae]
MRAVQLERFGGPDVLRAVDLPGPVAGPGQVVIDVAYADVLFLETQVRRDEAFFTPPLPHVPGGAVGGRITGIEQVRFPPEQAEPLLDRALFEAAGGRLSPVVGQTLPLADAARAHATIEAREAWGKTLLTVE